MSTMRFTAVICVGVLCLPGAAPQSAAQGLEYFPVDGCRVLDTRKWNQTTSSPIPGSRAVEFHLSNEFGDISSQGGDVAGCPAIPDDAAAFAVTITPIAPGFPVTPYPNVGFATLIAGDFGDWTPVGVTPGGNVLYTYDTPPFRVSSSVVYDLSTDFIANTTVVNACEDCGQHVKLYTSGQSHYVVDVVGYFTEISAMTNLSDAGLLGNQAGDLAQNNGALQVTLNADLLDGLSAGAFSLLGHTHDAAAIVSGALNVARYSAYSDLGNEGYLGNAAGDLARNNGALQATLNADLLDGQTSASFAAAAHNHDAAYVNVTGDWMSDTLTVSNPLPYDYAVKGLGGYGPTDGFLGVQGSDLFDGEPNAHWVGREIGVAGVATDEATNWDNYGVLGFSNWVGVRGEWSGDPNNNWADLGRSGVGITAKGTTWAGSFYGNVQVTHLEDPLIKFMQTDQALGEFEMYNSTGSYVTVELDSDLGGYLYLYDDAAGDMGIKMASTGSGGEVSLYQIDAQTGVFLDGDSNGAGLIQVRDASGATVIQIDGDYSGNGRVITQELQITGGSDLSETFDLVPTQLPVEPGMVLSIDPERPGQLTVSSIAYDHKVAGIISGGDGVKPGLIMGQQGTIADGAYPVALTGRVYCLADASEYPIRPGDLLTTSGLPGHAMKVTDHGRASGAIIGKAMTGLGSGRGKVLVLVSLQ